MTAKDFTYIIQFNSISDKIIIEENCHKAVK